MKEFIRIENLFYKYDQSDDSDNYALRGVDLTIYGGEFVAVVGHNGCGKSTLAKHMNSLYLPTTGDVYIDGIDTHDDERLFEIRKKVGLVLQNPDNQIVVGVVEEDVAFGCENLGMPPDVIRQRVDKALQAVNMYEYRKHSPEKLSGGQKQRVAIAGIIAMEPECIVLDEPTAMLDPQGREEVMNTIKQLNKELGITIVLITHFMEEAVCADRVVMMDEGKIAFSVGVELSYLSVNMQYYLLDIIERDERDMNREIAPLKQAEDAVLIDSSDMGIDDVLKVMVETINKKRN